LSSRSGSNTTTSGCKSSSLPPKPGASTSCPASCPSARYRPESST
jgi:hypothetical protein